MYLISVPICSFIQQEEEQMPTRLPPNRALWIIHRWDLDPDSVWRMPSPHSFPALPFIIHIEPFHSTFYPTLILTVTNLSLSPSSPSHPLPAPQVPPCAIWVSSGGTPWRLPEPHPPGVRGSHTQLGHTGRGSLARSWARTRPPKFCQVSVACIHSMFRPLMIG